MIRFKPTTLLLTIFTIIYAPLSWAQGIDVDLDLTDDSPAIMDNPLFWVGVAVVAIVIAFIIRGKKK